jgi:hypothetical protein
MYPNQDNPYAPPTDVQPYDSDFMAQPAEGSFGLGVALGAVLGLWGLLGCLFLGKAETKRGAKYGFLGRLGLSMFVVLVMLVVN